MRELADWWTRAGAFVLDQLIVAGVAFGVSFALARAIGDPGRTAGSLLFYGIVATVGFLYAPLLMARPGARNGQTLGKQAVGIRVVLVDGEPVGFWCGMLRTVVAQQLLIAVTFYLYALVDYLWPLRDAQNQALQDKIASTLVLRAGVPAAARGDWLPPQAPAG
jgi:uncharacterized RDD family membrane protein YckC